MNNGHARVTASQRLASAVADLKALPARLQAVGVEQEARISEELAKLGVGARKMLRDVAEVPSEAFRALDKATDGWADLPTDLMKLPARLLHKKSIFQVARTSKIKPSSIDARDAVVDFVLASMRQADADASPHSTQLQEHEVDLACFIPAPVQDQGVTSICVAEATTAMKSCQDQCADLNPYLIYAFRNDTAGDNGMTMKEAMHVLYSRGTYTYRQNAYCNIYLDPPGSRASHQDARFPPHTFDAVFNARHKILAYGRVHTVATAKELLALAHVFCMNAQQRAIASSKEASAMDGSQGFNIGCLPCIFPVFDGRLEHFWGPYPQLEGLTPRGAWSADRRMVYRMKDAVQWNGQYWVVKEGALSVLPRDQPLPAMRCANDEPCSSSKAWMLVKGQTRIGYHAVALVGYSESKQLLKFRNSWGLNFDDHGYFYVPSSAWGSIAECWFSTNDPVFAKHILDQVRLTEKLVQSELFAGKPVASSCS
jgi:hypothetical protein